MTVTVPFTVTEKIRPKPCPGVAEFQYARRTNDPAAEGDAAEPAAASGFWSERSRDAYADRSS